MHLSLRFDFRNPDFADTPTGDRYAAALDMVEWADGLGCDSITLSEHHGSPDGYIPSPIPMVAAMSQRAKNVRFMIAALIAPFHDPLRLAEDLAVLDNITNGRLDVVIAGGYGPAEFAMFGVAMKERPSRVTEAVLTLRAAFTGEPFEFRGRTVRVTPAPCQPGGPPLLLGAASEPAARRAARIADGLVPVGPHIWEWYRDEMVKLGKPDPGPATMPEPVITALASDVEKGWQQLGPFFLHDLQSYVDISMATNASGERWGPQNVEQLRAMDRCRVVTPDELIAEQKAAPVPSINLHPLCGGIPPELAWESLHLFEREVLPAFRP